MFLFIKSFHTTLYQHTHTHAFWTPTIFETSVGSEMVLYMLFVDAHRYHIGFTQESYSFLHSKGYIRLYSALQRALWGYTKLCRSICFRNLGRHLDVCRIARSSCSRSSWTLQLQTGQRMHPRNRDPWTFAHDCPVVRPGPTLLCHGDLGLIRALSGLTGHYNVLLRYLRGTCKVLLHSGYW